MTRIAPALSLVLAMTWSFPATAADVRVVTGNDYAPFTDESLPGGGLATELVVATFNALGDEVEVDFRPWARGYHDTRQGMFAGTFPYVHSDERATQVRYAPTPLASIQNIAVSSIERPVRFTGAASLRGLTLCRPLGYALPAVVEEVIEEDQLEVTGVSEIESCPRMIELGRADLFIPTNFTWPALVASQNLAESDFHVAEQPIQEQHLYFITADSDEGGATIERFERGFRIVRESGAYDEIFTRHIAEEAE